MASMSKNEIYCKSKYHTLLLSVTMADVQGLCLHGYYHKRFDSRKLGTVSDPFVNNNVCKAGQFTPNPLLERIYFTGITFA